MKMVITKQFQQFLAQYNVDPGQILEKARIPNYLWKEELSLDVPQYYRFLETLSTELTDTQLLAVSDVKDMGLFMPPFFAALCAADGLQAIKRLATYKKLIGPIKFDVQTAQDSVEIGISYLYPEQPLPRFALLNEQLIILSIVRMGTGKAIVPTGITGPYPYHHMIENTIGISATQSSDNRLVFKRSDLEQPFIAQNNTMWQFLGPEFKRQLATLNHDEPFVNAMRKELYRAIAAGDYAIETIARNLGV
ncbi:MAG TPA: AraC family transcriptional regulator, partial [Lactobacillus sp.]|nr:AraC family transcriptional regulator [Lactobacillus sp.]